MIYTLTMNPTLDITYVVKEISFDEPLSALEVYRVPGGKGISVSLALRSMGIESVAMGIVGGHVGEEVLELLQHEGLILQMVRIRNETRTNVIILGKRDGRQLVIRAAGPPVEDAASDRICSLILDKAQAPELLVISGSLPPGIDDDVYYSLIKSAKERGVRVVLDSSGEPFRQGIEAVPFLIKPNRSELEGLAGRGFDDEEEIIDFCLGLLDKGVSVVVVSLGEEGGLMVTDEGVWKGTVPAISEDTVGAGDSMVAGLVMGIVRSEPLEDMFRTGLACGVSAVMNRGPGLAEPGTFKEALELVTVERIQ